AGAAKTAKRSRSSRKGKRPLSSCAVPAPKQPKLLKEEAISRGQWQPQAAVSPLLGPTSAAKPLVNERGKPASQKPLKDECKAVCQAPAPHGTYGSCWLATAQQFYHDMGGEGGSRVKQGGHIHQPTAWPLPHACAQPYHTGSGSHGQLFRSY
ncbi:unnamed protein product, partial [Porites evermanni]